MAHIRQKNSVGTNSYTIVDLTGYVGELEDHQTIVNNPDLFEISEDAIPESHQLVNPSYEIASVKKLQLKLALIDFGIMPTSVVAAINQIEDVVVRETLLTLLSDADFFEKYDERLISMATSLGLNSAQTDVLFRLASTK
jgi:hypothetical protein